MKTNKNAGDSLPCFTLLVAVTSLTLLASGAVAQEKGAERLMKLNRSQTVADAQKGKAGDTFAMTCPRCKTIPVARTHTEKGHIKTTTVSSKHLCPACDIRLVTEGYGHFAKTRLVHTCTAACGSADAYCCATRRDEGPTKGMERN